MRWSIFNIEACPVYILTHIVTFRATRFVRGRARFAVNAGRLVKSRDAGESDGYPRTGRQRPLAALHLSDQAARENAPCRWPSTTLRKLQYERAGTLDPPARISRKPACHGEPRSDFIVQTNRRGRKSTDPRFWAVRSIQGNNPTR